MSYLFEVLTEKIMLDKKIEELKSILLIEQTDALAEELFNLLELKQSKLLHINTANTIGKLNVGGTEINIATAVIVRDTIKAKVDFLTTMISNKECRLDKVELQKQRDKYYGEYVLLSMGINRNDLNVTIG